MRTCGHDWTMLAATSRALTITCSQLSRISSRCRALRYATTTSNADPVADGSCRAVKIALATRVWSVSGARSTSHTPSGKPLSKLLPSCTATRVLPTPPEPTTVTSRCSRRSASTSPSSRFRATNEVNCCGRLCLAVVCASDRTTCSSDAFNASLRARWRDGCAIPMVFTRRASR